MTRTTATDTTTPTTTTPTTTTTTSTRTDSGPRPRPGRVVRLAPWATGLWVAAYLPMAALHLVRDTVPPWTPTPASVLGSLTPTSGSVLVAVLAVLVALTLATVQRAASDAVRRPAGWLLVGLGLVVTLLVSDVRALSFVGYLPMLALGLVGVGPAASGVDPAVFGDSLLALGSSLGGLAMVVVGAHVTTGSAAWRGTVAGARRAGAWAVAIAVLVPLAYATTRLAWTVGVPLGVREQFLEELGDARWAGFGLAVFAVVGVLLTLGLVQRWGEVFWSWLPVVGGRPVPVGMAVVPALFVAAIVTSAGLGFWRPLLVGHLADLPGAEQDWAAWAPELLWPLWGVALAVAALAYRRRRLLTAG